MTPKTESIKLLPCPFCGNIPTMSIGPEHSYIGGTDTDAILECCVELRKSYGEGISHDDGIDTAQKAFYYLAAQWNKRTPETYNKGYNPEAMEECVKALEVVRQWFNTFKSYNPEFNLEENVVYHEVLNALTKSKL